MSLVRMLMSGLRMLLRSISVLLALGMVALALMCGGRTMRLGSIFMMLCCCVVVVSGQGLPLWVVAPSEVTQPPILPLFQALPRLAQNCSGRRHLDFG